MKIKINGVDYPCRNVRVNQQSTSWRGVNIPTGTEIAGTIQTLRDDGFALREDVVSDFLRYELTDGFLTLTNVTIPEFAPMQETAEPTPTEQERLEAQVTYTAMMTDTLLEG